MADLKERMRRVLLSWLHTPDARMSNGSVADELIDMFPKPRELTDDEIQQHWRDTVDSSGRLSCHINFVRWAIAESYPDYAEIERLKAELAKCRPRELTDDEIIAKRREIYIGDSSSDIVKCFLATVRWAVTESYPDYAEIERLKTNRDRQISYIKRLEAKLGERRVAARKTESTVRSDEYVVLKAENERLKAKLAKLDGELSDESNIVMAQRDFLRARDAEIERLKAELEIHVAALSPYLCYPDKERFEMMQAEIVRLESELAKCRPPEPTPEPPEPTPEEVITVAKSAWGRICSLKDAYGDKQSVDAIIELAEQLLKEKYETWDL